MRIIDKKAKGEKKMGLERIYKTNLIMMVPSAIACIIAGISNNKSLIIISFLFFGILALSNLFIAMIVFSGVIKGEMKWKRTKD